MNAIGMGCLLIAVKDMQAFYEALHSDDVGVRIVRDSFLLQTCPIR